MTAPQFPSSATSERNFLDDVIRGFSGRQKYVPSKWLYDARGSELFEEITRLPEYYLTRAETGILARHAWDIAQSAPGVRVIVEYGSGASRKTAILIDAFHPECYIPVDISDFALAGAALRLRHSYPRLSIRPLKADILEPFTLDGVIRGPAILGFFPGSTIGNLADDDILEFLVRTRNTLGKASKFLIGFDLVKPPSHLLAAYNDSAGVTAAFNLNLLSRMRRELDADIDLNGFQHQAIWNPGESRMEMHLFSRLAQSVGVGGRTFWFQPGETIHTENSRKFSPDYMRELCSRSGWSPVEFYTDARNFFGVLLVEATG